MKGFPLDCTASLGNLHRKVYHIAVFAPKNKEKSVEYQPFSVQYYRRFYTLNFYQKTGGLYQIVALTKNRINTGFSR